MSCTDVVYGSNIDDEFPLVGSCIEGRNAAICWQFSKGKYGRTWWPEFGPAVSRIGPLSRGWPESGTIVIPDWARLGMLRLARGRSNCTATSSGSISKSSV